MKQKRKAIASLTALAITIANAAVPGTAFSSHASSGEGQPLWQAAAFGQSTDLDFSSTILDEKIGTNYVYAYDKESGLASASPLPSGQPAPVQDVAIESRGGKIQTGHDGLTFYYTEVPTSKNFVLTGTVTIEQMGPENGNAPNLQEGAGLMVRDVVSSPRQNPLLTGYEEYPAASNMAAVWVDGASKAAANPRLTIKSLARYGVDAREGSASAVRFSKDTNWLNGYDWAAATSSDAPFSDPVHTRTLSHSNYYHARMTLQLERTDETFIMRLLDTDGNIVNEYNYKEKDRNVTANIVENIDPDTMYVGFFAARNARMTVEDISLDLSDIDPGVERPAQYRAVNTEGAAIYQASQGYSNSESYQVQALTNFDGTITVYQNDVEAAFGLPVTGGQQFVYETTLSGDSTEFRLEFTADPSIETTGSLTANISFTVEKAQYETDIYVTPDGSDSGTGSQDDPMSLSSAIEKLIPGGRIYVAEGTYGYVNIKPEHSGSEFARKSLIAQGSVTITEDNADHYLFTLDSDYWNIDGFDIDGNEIVGSRGLYVYGSHNIITGCHVHHTKSDAGFAITKRRSSRSLWPSDNLVENCSSYSNRDTANINADGFASKSGSGDNNIFRYCVSYDNADDGWDLYNTLSGGKNGVTIIENCIAYNNGNNGFKLGGESLSVPHEIRNCIAYGNNLDGFTDNFNPGELIVENNTSYDNVRYNFIFRPSPYLTDADGNMTAMGRIRNNVSYRSTFESEKYGVVYDDKIWGQTIENNFFIENTSTELTDDDFVSRTPSDAYRWDRDQLVFGDFLRASKESLIWSLHAGAAFEADTEEPEIPEVPEVPEIPEVPEVPEIPDIPYISPRPAVKSSNNSSSDKKTGEWKQDAKGWWYKNSNGSYPKNQWQKINDRWYRFDEAGYMNTGWILIDGQWYYLQPQGHMIENNWFSYQGAWYYFGADGAMLKSQWVSYQSNWYYFDGEGKMISNSVTPDGYTVNSDGAWVH